MKEKEQEEYKQIAAKAKEAFSLGDYVAAAKHFTDAINLQPNNHLLYSNRCACYTSIKEYAAALEDAKKCIEIKPDFAKGYARKGLAEYYLKEYDRAVESYEAGLKLDPNNEELKEGLLEAKKASEANMFGTPEEITAKLASDPIVKTYFKDPEFVEKLNKCQGNPQMLFGLLRTDPRFIRVFHILTGIPMEQVIAASQQATPEPKDDKSKELADQEKVKGNNEYKARKFEEAIKHYDKAIEYHPKEPIYYLNKASVYIEEKKFEKALQSCDEALQVAESISPRPLDKVAKGYAKKGNCYVQMQKFDIALEMYNKSLLEVNDVAVKEARKKCIELKNKHEEQAYVNPELSEKHKEAGNKYFKEGNYSEAMKEYNEAIKRNPNNPVPYLNRALTWIKTVEYNRALEDIEKSLKLDPKYVKAYAKRGNVYYYLKEFHKALSAYEKGLQIDPTNQECMEGIQRTEETMYKTPPSEERAKKAMEDEEIRALMKDPRVVQMLKEMRESPMGTKPPVNDPFITQAVRKLIAAGILGMR